MSYNMPCFKVDGVAVAGYDGFKQHCSYFPPAATSSAPITAVPAWCTIALEGHAGVSRRPTAAEDVGEEAGQGAPARDRHQGSIETSWRLTGRSPGYVAAVMGAGGFDARADRRWVRSGDAAQAGARGAPHVAGRDGALRRPRRRSCATSRSCRSSRRRPSRGRCRDGSNSGSTTTRRCSRRFRSNRRTGSSAGRSAGWWRSSWRGVWSSPDGGGRSSA